MASLINSRARYTPRFVLRPFQVGAIVASDPQKRFLGISHRTAAVAAVGESRTTRVRSRSTSCPRLDGCLGQMAVPSTSVSAGRRNRTVTLGNVSVWFTSRANQVGEIGYWIRTGETDKGVCTEVTARILQIAFEELRLHRVTLRIALGNRGSERVAEKLGFLQEGTLREDVKVGGRWLDHTALGAPRRRVAGRAGIAISS